MQTRNRQMTSRLGNASGGSFLTKGDQVVLVKSRRTVKLGQNSGARRMGQHGGGSLSCLGQQGGASFLAKGNEGGGKVVQQSGGSFLCLSSGQSGGGGSRLRRQSLGGQTGGGTSKA